MSRIMTAVFTRPEHAEAMVWAFTADITQWFIEPGSVRLDGCTVTWRTDARADAEPEVHVMDVRQTVAYWGATGTGYPTLNGHPCRSVGF